MSCGWDVPFTGPLIVKRVKDAVILNLRRAFSTDATFPYVENPDGTVDFDCSKVVINDTTPDDYYYLPSINVTTGSGEEFRFLSGAIGEDYFEECSDGKERRGAIITFTLGIEATGLDVITRDELVDRLYQKFKIVTDDLAENGVGVIKTSIVADRKDFKNDRWFYTSGVSLRMYVEWVEEINPDPNATLTGTQVGITTDQGVFQEFRINRL